MVAVLTNADLPVRRDEDGDPAVQLLAGDEALHAGQPIAIVLAETDAAAQDGVELVEIEYEELPVVVDLEAAILPDAPHVSHGKSGAFDDEAAMHNADAATGSDDSEELPPNVSSSVNFGRGDIAQGFAEADEIVELTFDSLTVHQGYIETQVALAVPEMMEELTIYTSTQGAFHGRQKVSDSLGLPLASVNIVPMPVGGGFGGKFVLIEPLVAALAQAVRPPGAAAVQPE